MKKTKKLCLEIDANLLDEIIFRDHQKNFRVDENDVVYCNIPISKMECIISESSVAYSNKFIAINPDGEFLPNNGFDTIISADIEVHLSSHTVLKKGKIINIPRSCYIILESLLLAKDGTLRRDSLIRILESDGKRVRCIDENNLNQHIKRIHQALLHGEEGKPYIKAKYEYGYVWQYPIEKIKK